jgi:signal transduction histidine kinase
LSGERAVPDTTTENPRKLPNQTVSQLRLLAHDLSNSIETIMQAAYLLGQAKLDAKCKEWVRLLDQATHDAARINREIRDILRTQG